MELQERKPTFKGPADWFAGDVIVTPPGEWHWHGAAPDHFMAHLAFTEGDTEWGDHLSDEEYPTAS